MVSGRKDSDKPERWEKEHEDGCMVCLCAAGELVKPIKAPKTFASFSYTEATYRRQGDGI